MEEIPVLTPDNERQHLKKSQYFELQDSLSLYLGKVVNVLNKNDVAPLKYIQPNIKQVLLNRRRLDFIKKLELDVLNEGLEKKEFEIYE